MSEKALRDAGPANRRTALGRTSVLLKAVLMMTVLLAAAVPPAPGVQAGDTKKPEAKSYEAISLTGEKLVSPAADKASLDRYAEARQRAAKDPSEDNYIGMGRYAANAGKYREAIKAFTDGLARYPQSYRLLRFRGHRYITIRQFVRAIDDLARAAELAKGRPLEIEPDLVPNRSGKPLSNTHYNIDYHLGLAYYLSGDYPLADKAFRDCLTWSKNDDTTIAATDWLYLTLRRMKLDKDARDALAAVKARPTIEENFGYFQRILMYRGLAAPDLMTLPWDDDPPDQKKANLLIRLYGLGNWHLWGGDAFKALSVFESILKEKAWSYFAAIAAEVDAAELTLANPARGSVADALKSWAVMWNTYDLGLVYSLFTVNPPPTYMSWEKKGVIAGLEPLVEHHKGFGFIAGGKAQDNRLWLEDVRVHPVALGAIVTARWFLDKNVGEEGPVQQGPVTFVLVQAMDGYRIAHANFAND
jgi:tetratricopeptide (TPR) repeat protein